MDKNSFSVLMYHDIEETPQNQYSVSYKTFREHLSSLKSEGFVIEGFRELEKRLETADFPERYIVLTFDDGAKSSLKAADILREQGAQATFFLTKDFSDSSSSRYINAQEIKDLGKLCSIGSHGVTHRYLSKLSSSELETELVQSKRWLEDLLGRRISFLSAPGGFINEQVVRLATENGYTLLGNSVESKNTSKSIKKSKVVNRIAMRRHFDLSTFVKVAYCNPSFFLKRHIRTSLLNVPKILLSEAQIRSLCKAVGR